MAQDTKNTHVVMDAFDRGVLDSSTKIVELFSKADCSHDVETQEHRPSAGIDRLS